MNFTRRHGDAAAQRPFGHTPELRQTPGQIATLLRNATNYEPVAGQSANAP